MEKKSVLILTRLKDQLQVKTDAELSKILNVKPNTISTWKKRDTISYAEIIAICQERNISLDLIFTNSLNKNIFTFRNFIDGECIENHLSYYLEENNFRKDGMGGFTYLDGKEIDTALVLHFAEYFQSQQSQSDVKMNTVAEWRIIHEEIKKAEGSLAMYEMYIKRIFEFFDEKTVFDHLEEKSVNSSLKWNVHKLLFNYNPKMTETILKYLKLLREYEIERTDFKT